MFHLTLLQSEQAASALTSRTRISIWCVLDAVWACRTATSSSRCRRRASIWNWSDVCRQQSHAVGVLPTAGPCRAHLLTQGLCDLVAATAQTLGAVQAPCLQAAQDVGRTA